VAEPNIELILARSLAAHLAVPAFLSDSEGRFVYFNEAAELLLGRAFEDTPELTSEDLIAILKPCDDDGAPLAVDDMPMSHALASKLPVTVEAVNGRDGGERYLATAVPFFDRDGMVLGGLLFWYMEKE
jgi:PAS domain-containing protein